MVPTPAHRRSFTHLRDADKLQAARTAMEALDTEPEIIAAMTQRRYEPGGAKLAEGRALLQAVREAMKEQTEDTGDKLSATAGQNDKLSGARRLYAPLAATARTVFMDEPDVLTALGLKGTHRKSYAARIERMRGFVVEARKPERLARFAEETTDVGAAQMDALEAALDTAVRGMTAQDVAEARAEDASASRRAAFKALQRWMLKMQGHARVVLRGRPDLLEMLGIPPRR